MVRLNALGSLYFFLKFVLKRTRLVEHLHRQLAENLECENLNYLLELPRDHMKTTLVTEGLAIWWSLPFDERDEAAMRELGYGDAWVRWMRWAHSPQTRILIVSETAHNAIRLGVRIDRHFESNSLFRGIFPEIIPNERCTWNAESKCVKGAEITANGEGTFDFIGVGGAVQSRHYPRMIEDDLAGRDALKSEVVMLDIIEYHQLLEGVYDGPHKTNVIVNNRWSLYDLSGWVRENEPDVAIESHSALGGCCPRHAPGEPIFPEEFSVERLERIRRKLGPYLFSHQFLNQAITADDVVFQKEWLRFYSPTPSPLNPERHWLRHEVVEGEAYKDLDPRLLSISMVVDPNHAGQEGRAHHGIVVTGLDADTDRIYLLDCWARSTSYDELLGKIYEMASTWGLLEFWLETVAAQRILKYHIEWRNKIEKRTLRVRELKTERSKGSKWTRIDALAPLFQQAKVFVRRDQSMFLDEYYRYAHSTRLPVDVLDCLGYAPQTWTPFRARELYELAKERREKYASRKAIAGY